MTEDIDNLKDLIRDVGIAVKNANIQGRVSLQILVNCGGNHWCLAQVDTNNQAIESAVLWDPMRGNPKEVEKSQAFKNFSKVISDLSRLSRKKVNVKLEFAGKQTDDFTCMDWCLDKAFRTKGDENTITLAANPQERRLAIIKRIAENPENQRLMRDEGVAQILENMESASGGKSSRKNTNTKKKSKPKINEDLYVLENPIVQRLEKVSTPNIVNNVSTPKEISPDDIDMQIKFDKALAEHLQQQYNENKNKRGINEKALFIEARNITLKEFGFFSENGKDISKENPPEPEKNKQKKSKK